ncbi:MAG TPA: type II toxin-antitoxin system HicB family antitoxin [Anaerolineae bacterium]|nr:type II toxin-antitoxin system HicB family antitoxin [Anaerolineae bacterium]HQI86825.1 type II toxin-antitoxin system HicB family antitoxin [Anaerolineae bacterium]
MEQPGFIFTGVIFQEGEGYTALCPDLDVASQGDSVSEAKAALLEAVTLYLETALENNLPWLRPIPRDEDPRFVTPELITTVFPLKVHAEVYAYA